MPSSPEAAQVPDDQDLTTKEEQPIKTNNTIEELKSRLSSVETDESSVAMIPETQRPAHHHPQPPLLNEEGLIIPRKPPNPVKENSERKSLHREMMFNQKIGKNVLNQKSELQRALEKQKENLAKKEMENHMGPAKTPELEKVIADRAKRMQANSNDEKNEDDKVINKEFLQARMKLKNRSDSK